MSDNTKYYSLPGEVVKCTILGVCYVVLFCIAVRRLARTLHRGAHLSTAFNLFLGVGMLGRIVSQILDVNLVFRNLTESTTIVDSVGGFMGFWVLDTIPSFFLLSCYGILVVFCIEMHFTVHKTPARAQLLNSRVRIVVAVINVLGYAVLVALYASDFVDRYKNDQRNLESVTVYEQAILLFDASLYLLNILAFLIFGLSIYLKVWRLLQIRPSAAGLLLQKLGRVLLVVNFIFTVRVFVVVAGAFTTFLGNAWYFLLPYFFICEVIPISLIIYGFGQREEPNNNSGEKTLLIQGFSAS